MGIWRRESGQGPSRPPDQYFSDLGSQLEDLITHVMHCERWARFDDLLDLASAVERIRPARAGGRRAHDRTA